MTVKELLCEQVKDALDLQTSAGVLIKKAQRQIYTAQRMSRTIKANFPELLDMPVSSLADAVSEAPK